MKSKCDVQREGQQIAQFDAAGTEAGASASSPVSSADSQPSGKRAGRDRQGRFARGNAIAVKHGRFSSAVAKALLPEQREVLAIFAQHEAALLVDLGGASELSTFELDLVRKYQQLDAIAEYNASRMLSPRAAVRREARDTFMTAIDRQIKIIAQLGGPRRRQKDVLDLSAAEYAAQAQAQEGGHGNGSGVDGSGNPRTQETGESSRTPAPD